MLAGPEVPICILLPSPTSVCVSRLFGAEQTHETPQGKACGMLLRPPKNTHATAKRYRDWVCATVSDTALQLNLCNAPMISEACIGSLPDQVASLERARVCCVCFSWYITETEATFAADMSRCWPGTWGLATTSLKASLRPGVQLLSWLVTRRPANGSTMTSVTFR